MVLHQVYIIGPCGSDQRGPFFSHGALLEKEERRTWNRHGYRAVLAGLVLSFALPTAAGLDIGTLDPIGPAPRTAHAAVAFEMPVPARHTCDGDRGSGGRAVGGRVLRGGCLGWRGGDGAAAVLGRDTGAGREVRDLMERWRL